MGTIKIPVRYYKDYPGGYEHGYEDLVLPFAECAFLLVDVDGGYSIKDGKAHPTTEQYIAPALSAARGAQMKGGLRPQRPPLGGG